MTRDLNPADVQYADFVVVGRISNYELVRGYARFRIAVQENLLGETPRVLTVTWYNSTFALPETFASGEYLVALNTESRDPEASMTVLQASCSPPFIFEPSSAAARAVLQQLPE